MSQFRCTSTMFAAVVLGAGSSVLAAEPSGSTRLLSLGAEVFVTVSQERARDAGLELSPSRLATIAELALADARLEVTQEPSRPGTVWLEFHVTTVTVQHGDVVLVTRATASVQARLADGSEERLTVWSWTGKSILTSAEDGASFAESEVRNGALAFAHELKANRRLWAPDGGAHR